MRRTNATPNDVVLVKRDRLTPALLARATRTLQVARAMMGDVPTSPALYRVGSKSNAQKFMSDAADWAGILNRWKASEIEGVGTVASSMSVLMPNQKTPR